MSAENTSVELAREITLYNVRGGNLTKIQSFAKTWGELKSEVRKAGFDVERSLVTESVNKTDLVSDLAVLPPGAFRLYLRPKEVKSGLDRKELFAAIKEHVTAHPESKHLFIIDGCNMTQLSTSKLQELYDSHILMGKPTSKPAQLSPEPKVKEKVKVKDKPVKKLKKAKAAIKELRENVSSEDRPIQSVEMALSLIQSVPASQEREDAELAIEILLDILKGVVPEETEEEACAREAREIFGR